MGWNGSDRRTEETGGERIETQPPRIKHGLIAGLIVVFALATVFFLLLRPSSDAGRRSPSPKKAQIPTVAARKVNFDTKDEKNPKLRQALETLNEKADPIELERLRLAAKFAKLPKPAKSIFRNSSEQLLSWICETEPGEMPMPMPKLQGEQLQNLVTELVEKNELQPGDSDEIVAVKENLNEAKAEMLKHIKDGGDPNEFLQHYNDQLIRCFEFRTTALQQISELCDEDRELAREFLEKVNKRFDAEGIKRISEDEAGFDADPTPAE